jgi:hypothetical protein
MNDHLPTRQPLERSEKKRIGYFEPLRWGGLPGFWLYLVGAVLLTAIVGSGLAYALIKLGVQ